jgi:hypothetical protein
MKIAGIFRGFPGLGRVVSGVELITHFKDHLNADIQVFSYLQGEKYLNQRGFTLNHSVSEHDFSSIGIIPVSSYGEYIFNQIADFNPDFVLIDGEPLMVQAIKLIYPNLPMVSILNPSDVDNPSNQLSSQNFFNFLYSLSDIVIVHGLRIIKNPGLYKNFFSINTIIRSEIFEIQKKRNKKEIFCILGGGTVNVQTDFLESTLKIADKCIGLAKEFLEYKVTIQCSSINVLESITEKLKSQNITNLQLISTINKPIEYYGNASLIITRAGRNSLSELLYLKIPSISFISGCTFRKDEQISNTHYTQNSIINNLSIDIELPQFIEYCKSLLNTINHDNCISDFIPGNIEAIEIILDLYQKRID